MRVLLDTNIVLDLFLARQPFAAAAAQLWDAAIAQQYTAFVSPITVVNLFYITRKNRDRDIARHAVNAVINTVQIVPISQQTLQYSISLQTSDYEDAVQIASAALAQLDAIVTRDNRGFSAAPITVLSPDALLEQLRNGEATP